MLPSKRTQELSISQKFTPDNVNPIARRVSVIVPVKNEAASIGQLIANLQRQTYPPAEIVIADGGSSDDTKEIIRKLQLNSTIPIILVEDQNAFPGRGRNLAIRRAANEWLACVDAGIVPEANWLAELVAASSLDPEKQFIQGRYEPVTDSYFTECAAIAFVAPPGSQASSIASCLLHRTAWEAAGGFPEDLRASEDLIFFRRLEITGALSAFCAGALVHWHLQANLKTTFRRFATYSRYGMKAGLGTQWQLRVSLLYSCFLFLLVAGMLFWRPLILLPILLLVLRSDRRIFRWYASRGTQYQVLEVLNPRRVFMVTWINFVIDLATFRGMLEWLFVDLLGRRKGKPATEPS